MPDTQSEIRYVRFGAFEADLRTRELRKNGVRLKFTGQPFHVLAILLERPGELVTREELQNRVWPDTIVDVERNLNTAINKVREVLGDVSDNPGFIETLPRRGYRFIGAIEEPQERIHGLQASPAEMPADADLNPVPEPARRQLSRPKPRPKKLNKRVLATLGLLCGVAIIISAAWYILRPLPPPRITAYSQITHDGHEKSFLQTDGNRIYFTQISPRLIAEVGITGGEIAQIPVMVPGTQHYLLGVSPDGSNLLVGLVEEGHPGITLWMVGTLTGTAHRLGNIVGVEDATLSPDGNSVVYATVEGEIWVVRSDGTGAHKLASAGIGAYGPTLVFRPTFSPDGKSIRFDRDAMLWEISSSGLNLHPLLQDWRGSRGQCCGRWTPDGRFFLFLAWDSTHKIQIWALDERRMLLRKPHADPIQLTTGPISWDQPIPGKNGGKIFAAGEIPRGELSVFDVQTGRMRPFLGGISAEGVSFSRDGKSVAYVSYPEGILWKANRDGSNPLQLTSPPISASLPRWSPDGALILFDDMASVGRGWKAYIVPSEGGTPRRLLPEDKGLEAEPGWSADGRRVVFSTGIALNPKSDLRIFDWASRRVETIPGSVGMISPRWSPDGRYIASRSYDEHSLKVFDTEKQRWSVLLQTVNIGSFDWSSDSKFIYFVQYGQGGGSVDKISLLGSKTEQVADLRDWHFTGAQWRPWMGLDPTASPLMLRDLGSDDIYALTLEEK